MKTCPPGRMAASVPSIALATPDVSIAASAPSGRA